MKEPKDFYFYGPVNNPDPIGDEPEFSFVFISKEFWDVDEGIDCMPEPSELFDILDKLGGCESMENIFDFPDMTAAETIYKVIDAGFIYNADIANDPLV